MSPRGAILMVAHDLAVGAALAEALQEEGYPTLLAANGADAMVVLDQTRPCVLVLDGMMPVLDGVGVRAIQHDAAAGRDSGDRAQRIARERGDDGGVGCCR